jgi:hypothetical protein
MSVLLLVAVAVVLLGVAPFTGPAPFPGGRAGMFLHVLAAILAGTCFVLLLFGPAIR